MSYISLLIVDDDLNKITAIIDTIKAHYTDILSISQASNVQEAIENLQKKEFHLLITDLQMPLKFDDSPNDKGGEALIRSLYRRRSNVNVPLYIVGLTQFPDLQRSFNGVWNVWQYDSSLVDWKLKLRDLIFHISKIRDRIVSNKIETVFLEGPTDKQILENAINIFFPNMCDKIYFDTIMFGGGASWVERQLFIWAKSLTLKQSSQNEYLKAIGIFDSDQAGFTAISKIRGLIELHSAESKTYSIIRYSSKYSPLLKSIKSKGIELPITLEELFHVEIWKIAEKKNWLQNRDLSKITINRDIISANFRQINIDMLASLGFSSEEILVILHVFKFEHKKDVCNLICNMDLDSRSEMLLSINYLLQDVIEKLKI